VDTTVYEERDEGFELTVTNQRISSDQGEVERLEPIDHVEHPANQRVPLAIGQFLQGHAAAQVGGFVRVAARAMQRAFASDFDGKRGPAAPENRSPSPKHVQSPQETVPFRRG
jgi:hypothetical protein